MDALVFLDKVLSAIGNAKTVQDLFGASVYPLLDEIGDNHSRAAKLAMQRGDSEAAIANLYPCLTAYEKTMKMGGLAHFLASFTSGNNDPRAVAAEKYISSASLMATWQVAKGKPDEVDFWRNKAVDAFGYYEGAILNIHTMRSSLAKRQGQSPPPDPTPELARELKAIEDKFNKIKPNVRRLRR